MTIFITGAAGFLGVRLTEKLVESGYSVRVLLRKKRPHRFLDKLPIEVVEGDILDKNSIRRAMQDCKTVFHCAGMVSYDPRKAEMMHAINIEGTRNIAEVSLELGIEKLVYTSSIAAIGVNYDPQKILNENTPFNARCLGMAYFNTKYDAEQELAKFASRGLSYVIVNPGSILGPRDTRKKGQVYVGLIHKLNPPISPPGGNNFVDLEDVVDGHILAWKKGRPGERYILGGENLTFAELIARTNSVIGRTSPRFTIPVQAMKVVAMILKVLRGIGLKFLITPELVKQIGSWYLFVDSHKAKAELGYSPRPIDSAIQKTLEWLRVEGGIR